MKKAKLKREVATLWNELAEFQAELAGVKERIPAKPLQVGSTIYGFAGQRGGLFKQPPAPDLVTRDEMQKAIREATEPQADICERCKLEIPRGTIRVGTGTGDVHYGCSDYAKKEEKLGTRGAAEGYPPGYCTGDYFAKESDIEMANARIAELEANMGKACGICGTRMLFIRGRYPGEDRREVCPTCSTERLEQIQEVLNCRGPEQAASHDCHDPKSICYSD